MPELPELLEGEGRTVTAGAMRSAGRRPQALTPLGGASEPERAFDLTLSLVLAPTHHVAITFQFIR